MYITTDISISPEEITDFKTTDNFKNLDKFTAMKKKEMKQVLCAGKRITEARYTAKMDDLYAFLACLEPIRDNAMAITPEMISPSMPIFYHLIDPPPFTAEALMIGKSKEKPKFVFTALSNFRRLTVVKIRLDFETARDVILYLEAKGYQVIKGTFDFSP